MHIHICTHIHTYTHTHILHNYKHSLCRSKMPRDSPVANQPTQRNAPSALPNLSLYSTPAPSS
ncbi:hypothetical protein EON63_13870, partial [archaeon]